MSVSSHENKALLWDVLLSSGFFNSLHENDYAGVKAALDGYVSDPDLTEIPLIEANKAVIESMHLHIVKLLEARTSRPKAQSRTAYQRSSTI